MGQGSSKRARCSSYDSRPGSSSRGSGYSRDPGQSYGAPPEYHDYNAPVQNYSYTAAPAPPKNYAPAAASRGANEKLKGKYLRIADNYKSLEEVLLSFGFLLCGFFFFWSTPFG